MPASQASAIRGAQQKSKSNKTKHDTESRSRVNDFLAGQDDFKQRISKNPEADAKKRVKAYKSRAQECNDNIDRHFSAPQSS